VTVKSGQLYCQVTPYDGTVLSDSHADSAGSIPVTRYVICSSTKHQVSGLH